MSTTAADPTHSIRPRDRLQRGLRLTLILCLVGFVLGLALQQIEASYFRDNFALMTIGMFRGQDTVWLGVSLAVGLLLYWGRGLPDFDRIAERVAALVPVSAGSGLMVGGLALVVLIAVGAGTYLIHHAFAFASDEYMGELQAEIFRTGRTLAPVADEWNGHVRALFTPFLMHDPAHQLLGSGYRPGYAAIRALFDLISLGQLANAALTALSVVLVASIARKLWPDRRDAALLAAVLLATGPQLLFTGMSGFAWPAHLCLNLLWLRLYLRDDGLGHGLAALVGFVAIGLHQINPHPFFVLPFMLSLLFARRWLLAGFYASTYSTALALWIFWPDIAIHLSAGGSTATAAAAGLPAGPSAGAGYVAQALGLIGLKQVAGLPLIVTNLLRLLAWQNLAVVLLIFIALRRWSGAPQIVRLLAWSCVLTMIPYVLIMPNQMYGWGYRYAHGLLGNMALIAAFGWISLSAEGDALRAAAKRVVIGFTALVVFVGLPLRAVQVEGFIAPYVAANRHIQSLPSDLVLIDVSRIWIWGAVVRNDPFLSNRPLVLATRYLTDEQVRRLCGRYTVSFVGQEDLAPFGVPEMNPPPPKEARSDGLSAAVDGSGVHACPAM